MRSQIQVLCVEQGLFSDVMFQLEDFCLPAHRSFLVVRCDVMKAMFTGDFKESGSKVVSFSITVRRTGLPEI